jgi:hypothetical protein
MLVPLFSVGFYSSEKQDTIYENLLSEEVYDKIPTNELSRAEFRGLNCNEIYNNMTSLLVDESFRAIWHNSQPNEKYILITKTGFRGDSNFLVSPDSLDGIEEMETNELITLGADKMLPVHIISNTIPNPSMVQRMSKVKLPNSPDSDDEKKPFNYFIFCSRNLNFIYTIFNKLYYSKPLLPV